MDDVDEESEDDKTKIKQEIQDEESEEDIPLVSIFDFSPSKSIKAFHIHFSKP